MIDTEVSNAFAYSYYYDNNGNITKIQNGTKQSDGTYTYSASSGNKYEYDRYNQLTKDTDYDNGTVTTYTYDTNGNITQKSVAYGSDTKDRGRFLVLTLPHLKDRGRYVLTLPRPTLLTKL